MISPSTSEGQGGLLRRGHAGGSSKGTGLGQLFRWQSEGCIHEEG